MKRVLVIDDESLVRNAIRLFLESVGYAVDEAAEGDEGIRKFEATQPDLVITDIIMPNKEGIETIIELRRITPAAKILAISGGGRLGDMTVLDYAAKLGASIVLQKPFDPDTLWSAVGELIG